MALTRTQIMQITDSISQAINDFNTVFVTGTGTGVTPNANSIISGVVGTSASNTLGRVLGLADLTPELNMLAKMNQSASNVTAYITGLRTLSSFYTQFYPIFDALDLTANVNGVSGLNNYLANNGLPLQVNAWFANAFNQYATSAVTLGYRSVASAPVPIATANYFPYASIDNMWGFTCNGSTTFSTNAVGVNASTSVSGGGVGQFVLYKVNSGTTVGGAIFTIVYQTAIPGVTSASIYQTASGVPQAGGTLAAGYSLPGAIGTKIISVTGTGMTSPEQYVIGMNLVRPLSGY